MTKTYKSYTQIAFSIILPGGGHRRISFVPRTGGGSVFVTEEQKVQAAIEKHPSFGVKFFLQPEPKSVLNAGVSKRLIEEATEIKKEVKKVPEKQEVREVPFTNLSDAKEYLAKNFEVGRTLLRSREAIKKYASIHGVIFVGIDDK